AESQRDTEKADADLRKAGSDDRASASPERQPKCADRLGNISSVIHSGIFLSRRYRDPKRGSERLKIKGRLVPSKPARAAHGFVINKMIADRPRRSIASRMVIATCSTSGTWLCHFSDTHTIVMVLLQGNTPTSPFSSAPILV